ncbi:FAD binding domain protein [Armillaria gallica]|uniref:FAD binding domain protein n=1 Tax=Armillaria gallica TaxID=47427 RepID=A0A2H3CT75_ARMGA|nr:FAD binding domain protein [Armillaria gallica]
MALVVVLVVILSVLGAFSSARQCRVIPGDPEWPSQAVWDALNKSVDGRLIKTVPLASPCHAGESFDPDECTKIRSNWHTPEFHETSSSSIMSAPFSNRSCDPFLTHLGCSTGDYVEYTVNVSSPAHVQRAVAFASTHNIRFVVRNSGHDYMGKSTGSGALAVWTHHLTDTEWFDSFHSGSYRGPAVKMQAGVPIAQMYEEASARGFTIVGGDCPSVGMAGGFIQGGGVGPLSTIHGMLADNALSFEVITTTGRFVNASRTENSDLFWALSGGGPGTYAIVWSVTVKVQPDMPISGASVSFAVGGNVTLDMWWAGVNAYRAMTAGLIEKGGYSLAVYTQGTFELSPMLLPNSTLGDIATLLNPFLANLRAIGIPYNASNGTFPGFLEAHTALFPTPLFAIQNTVVGGRLLPKSLWQSKSKLTKLNKAIRDIIDNGAGAYDISVSPGFVASGKPNNAVLPSWRETQSSFAIYLPWNDTGTFAQYEQQQHTMTNVFMESLKSVSPGSGAYLNEADAFDPDWKNTFYGSNYQKLLHIKDTWDPDQLLYGTTAVGGDRWVRQDNGRLCRSKGSIGF